MRYRNLLAVLTLLPTVLLAAPKPSAVHAGACVPQVRDAWVRMPPMMPMGAGYFVLANPCRTAVTLVGARSDRFADTSMHETRVEGGISRMQPLERVTIEPGGRAAFAPGGRHLMLMQPRGDVTVGSTVRLELELADGRRLTATAPVRAVSP